MSAWLSANWPIILTFVLGALVVLGVGIAANSTASAGWAGLVVGILIGIIFAWQSQRRSPPR